MCAPSLILASAVDRVSELELAERHERLVRYRDKAEEILSRLTSKSAGALSVDDAASIVRYSKYIEGLKAEIWDLERSRGVCSVVRGVLVDEERVVIADSSGSGDEDGVISAGGGAVSGELCLDTSATQGLASLAICSRVCPSANLLNPPQEGILRSAFVRVKRHE